MSLTRQLTALYSKPLASSRSGPLYNAFSYPTKISPEAIAVFIATHTKPHARILDVFGGSGTTGLAALLCDRPTPEMKRMAKELGVKPNWGPRIADIYELSTLGAFVAKTLTSPPDPEIFEKTARDLLERAESQIGWLYNAEDPDGCPGKIRYTIWTDLLVCPKCATEVTYWEAAVRKNPLRLESSFECKSCKARIPIDKCKRVTETITDRFLHKRISQKKRIPVSVYGATKSKKWSRLPSKEDLIANKKASELNLPETTPTGEILWGDLYRSGYHKGITHLQHFYTPRNFLAMATLWNLINEFPDEVQNSLRLLVLSYNSTHSTLMTRVVIKKNQKDFILTGAQSGVLYVSGLPVEKNVIDGVKRKIRSFKKAFYSIQGSRSVVHVTNASSTLLKLKAESVDYVFTDPPFGDYIPYSEINQINELWLGCLTDRTAEIIVSEAQKKGLQDYELLMGSVFQEISRVLKPKGLATVVFHSASSLVWQALVNAYGSAHLSVKATSVLDKLQTSFKQGVSTISVKGDPLILLSKGAPIGNMDSKTATKVAMDILRQAKNATPSERTPQRLFSRYVSRCLELGLEVHMGARAFYAYVEATLRN